MLLNVSSCVHRQENCNKNYCCLIIAIGNILYPDMYCLSMALVSYRINIMNWQMLIITCKV